MKKTLSILMAAILSLCAFSALGEAEGQAMALPSGVSFGMTLGELTQMLGDDAECEVWDEADAEVGCVFVANAALGIGELTALDLSFQVDRNNSPKAPRLSLISGSLEAGKNVIASFREAVAAFSESYGEPDADPFDENGVQSYREYGSLYATWTKPDVRVNLYMSRMYDERLNFDYSYRLNYDAADLAP